MPLKTEKELPAIKPVKTDYSNLNLSRDEFMEKRRKEKELEKRLEIERLKIEEEFKEEDTKKKRIKKEKSVEKETETLEE